ncbi:MAG: DinB family protein [Terriglobales bacterium]
MSELGYLRRLFAYDDWANREVTRLLEAASEPPPRSVRLLGHIAGAEWTWYGRIAGKSAGVAVWPEIGVREFDGHWERLRQAWAALLDAPRLDETVAYTNSRGQSFVSVRRTHLALEAGLC